jgi:hypothetical protein
MIGSLLVAVSGSTIFAGLLVIRTLLRWMTITHRHD